MTIIVLYLWGTARFDPLSVSMTMPFGETKTLPRSGRVNLRGAPVVDPGWELRHWCSAAWGFKLDCDVWPVLASRPPCKRNLAVWILYVGPIKERVKSRPGGLMWTAQVAKLLFGLFFFMMPFSLRLKHDEDLCAISTCRWLELLGLHTLPRHSMIRGLEYLAP